MTQPQSARAGDFVDGCLDQVSEDGFGDRNNRYAWSMKAFEGNLFVGTFNTRIGLPFEGMPGAGGQGIPDIPDIPEIPDFAHLLSDGGEIWGFDGSQWAQVVDGGFGDSGNLGIRSMAVHDNALYAGTLNPDTGCEVWRTRDGRNWRQVGADGFRNPLNMSVRGMATFLGRLYVGTSCVAGGQVWSTDGFLWVPHAILGIDSIANTSIGELFVHRDQLYAGTWNATGCHLYRYNGLRWTQVVGPEANTPAGFGDRYNSAVMSMEELDGALYVGTANFVRGFSVWRSFDEGETWEQVGRNGFGDFRAKYAWDMHVHHDELYLGTFMMGLIAPFRKGAQLYRTADGDQWDREVGPLGSLAPPGFLDLSNYGFRTLETYRDDLYVGSAQCFFCPLPVTGTEIWKRDTPGCDH